MSQLYSIEIMQTFIFEPFLFDSFFRFFSVLPCRSCAPAQVDGQHLQHGYDVSSPLRALSPGPQSGRRAARLRLVCASPTCKGSDSKGSRSPETKHLFLQKTPQLITSGCVNADNLIKISIRQANTKQRITRKDMQHAAMPWKEVAPGTHIKSQQDPFHKVMYLLPHVAPDQSSQSARLSTLVTHHTVTHTHTEISIMETARKKFQPVGLSNDTRPWW